MADAGSWTEASVEKDLLTDLKILIITIMSESEKLISCSLGKLLNLECEKESEGQLRIEGKLQIPDYQRNYSWTETQVRDLLNDTCGIKNTYLMGTVILHQHVGNKEGTDATLLDIVDGQQRLVTLSILLYCLELENDNNNDQSELGLLSHCFSPSSYAVIKRTQLLVNQFLSRTSVKKEELRESLLNKLQFNVLILSGESALDLAYTFFDSVNSKGRALTDFDLLKAHHLMYIPSNQEAIARQHNDRWQARDEYHLQVFTLILRRLRMWSRGLDRDSWAPRPDFEEFKSVVEPEAMRTGVHKLNRYMQPNAFSSWRRVNNRVVISMDMPMDEGEALIPTEVTQSIEGGDAFFIFAERYHSLYQLLYAPENMKVTSEALFVRELGEHISNQYLANAFKAIMLLYVDKFGEQRLVDVAVCVEQILSQRRWESSRLTIEAVLSHVRYYRIVPIMLEAVNDRHAFVQLLEIAQLMKVPEDKKRTGTQVWYNNRLSEFYRPRSVKIQDERVTAMIEVGYLKEAK